MRTCRLIVPSRLLKSQHRSGDLILANDNQWRDDEVAPTLRLLEIVGCADIPVSIIKKEIPIHCGWSRTTVSCAAISHLPFTFLSTIRMRPSTVTPALVAW